MIFQVFKAPGYHLLLPGIPNRRLWFFSCFIGSWFIMVWVRVACVHTNIAPLELLSIKFLCTRWYICIRPLKCYCWGVFLWWWGWQGRMIHYHYISIYSLPLWLELGESRFLSVIVMLQVLRTLLFMHEGYYVGVWKNSIPSFGNYWFNSLGQSSWIILQSLLPDFSFGYFDKMTVV